MDKVNRQCTKPDSAVDHEQEPPHEGNTRDDEHDERNLHLQRYLRALLEVSQVELNKASGLTDCNASTLAMPIIGRIESFAVRTLISQAVTGMSA